MDLGVAALGLCFVVPAAAYVGVIASRWLTWPKVEGKVLRTNRDKGTVKVTYVVGGRSRTAIKNGWPVGSKVGDPVVVRYDPERQFRTQMARPIWRSLCMAIAALSAAAGVLIMSEAATSHSEDIDLPWAVTMGLGLVAFAGGGAIASYQGRRLSWRTVDGKVVGVREQKRTDKDGTTSVTYDVRYTFVDDLTETTCMGMTSTFFRRHEQGMAVPVRYDAADPERSDISTPRDRILWWASAVALLAVGAGLVLLGILDASSSAP